MTYINYAFIDESGDLGIRGSNFFTIAVIITKNPKELYRIIKKLRQRKLKKKLKELPEIKANNSNRIIREFVLKKLKLCNCKIFAIVVDKGKILPRLYNVKDRLYNYLCGLLLDKINFECKKLIITIDKKHTNTLIRKDFDEYIKRKIGKDKEKIIFHKPSYSSNELQVVDFVAWSINRKFNTGDDYYYNIIKEKIENKDNMLLWK